jgi:hypothetical protein
VALQITERYCAEHSVNANGTERIVRARIGEPLPHSGSTFMNPPNH